MKAVLNRRKKPDREKSRGVNSIVQCTQSGIAGLGLGDSVEIALDRNSINVKANYKSYKKRNIIVV